MLIIVGAFFLSMQAWCAPVGHTFIINEHYRFPGTKLEKIRDYFNHELLDQLDQTRVRNRITYTLHAETPELSHFILFVVFEPKKEEDLAYVESFIAAHQGQDILGKRVQIKKPTSLVSRTLLSVGRHLPTEGDAEVSKWYLAQAHYVTHPNYSGFLDKNQEIKSAFNSAPGGGFSAFVKSEIGKYEANRMFVLYKELGNDIFRAELEFFFLYDTGALESPFLNPWSIHRNCTNFPKDNCL